MTQSHYILWKKSNRSLPRMKSSGTCPKKITMILKKSQILHKRINKRTRTSGCLQELNPDKNYRIGEKSCQRHIILSELWIRDESACLDVAPNGDTRDWCWKYYFTQRGLEQAGNSLYSSFLMKRTCILWYGNYRWNAFRPDNNVKLPMRTKVASAKRYQEFQVAGAWFVSMGVAGAHGKLQLVCYFTSYLTSQTLLDWRWNRSWPRLIQIFLLLESDEYERHFMPTTPEYSIITNIDFWPSRYFPHESRGMFSMPLTTMLNKLLWVFVYGEDAWVA